MRKTFLSFLVLALLLVFGGGGWVGYQSFTTGFTAKTEPSPWEVVIARKIRRLAIPSETRSMPNPVPMSPAVLKESLAHFADHCAICHANDGSGQTPIGKNVYPKAPDLRLEDTQSMSDGELFFTIHNGIRFTAMPAWGEGDLDKDTGSWKLVHFIRHLPQLTPHELDEMKTLNPKAPHDQTGHAGDAETGSGHHH